MKKLLTSSKKKIEIIAVFVPRFPTSTIEEREGQNTDKSYGVASANDSVPILNPSVSVIVAHQKNQSFEYSDIAFEEPEKKDTEPQIKALDTLEPIKTSLVTLNNEKSHIEKIFDQIMNLYSSFVQTIHLDLIKVWSSPNSSYEGTLLEKNKSPIPFEGTIEDFKRQYGDRGVIFEFSLNN